MGLTIQNSGMVQHLKMALALGDYYYVAANAFRGKHDHYYGKQYRYKRLAAANERQKSFCSPMMLVIHSSEWRAGASGCARYDVVPACLTRFLTKYKEKYKAVLHGVVATKCNVLHS